MKSRLSFVVSGLLSVVLIASCTDDQRPTTDHKPQTTDHQPQTGGYTYCLRCHGEDGSGSADVPDIRGRGIWKAHPDSVLFVLVFGMATQYSEDSVMRTMPPVPYTDEEIAEVGQYVNRLIGKRDVTYSAADVQRVREAHKARLAGKLSLPTGN